MHTFVFFHKTLWCVWLDYLVYNQLIHMKPDCNSLCICTGTWATWYGVWCVQCRTKVHKHEFHQVTFSHTPSKKCSTTSWAVCSHSQSVVVVIMGLFILLSQDNKVIVFISCCLIFRKRSLSQNDVIINLWSCGYSFKNKNCNCFGP